jgi:hypothetical protein
VYVVYRRFDVHPGHHHQGRCDDDDRDGHRNVGILRTPNAADSPRRLYQVHSPRKHQDLYCIDDVNMCILGGNINTIKKQGSSLRD